MLRYLIQLLFLNILFLSTTSAQSPSKSEREILEIYKSQLQEGLGMRGMSDSEIEKYLSEGMVSETSLNDFAIELWRLYPESMKSKIAILFYVFNNDTLFRFHFEPGMMIGRDVVPIKRVQLEQLNVDVYNTLDIYDLASTRSPKQRGLKPVKKKSPSGMTYQKAIDNATRVLLPATFSEKYEHLIIIPAFTIGAFPFQLLQPYKDDSLLIDRCSFAIAPSLMDLVALRKRIIKFNPTLRESAIEDAEYKFTLRRPMLICNPAYPTNTQFKFPDLPGAKKEIDSVKKYAEEYILLEGANATKANVLESLRSCDIAYFATHGISSEVNPRDNNFLVLAGNDDPFLTSRNIMALRDSTYYERNQRAPFPELVILSACQTGLGKSMEAGITAGVARSFLIAGANQVIMSLWNVDDEATAFLMSRFIYHLHHTMKINPAESLRLAELDTRRVYKNPAQWASFSVYGVCY